jgi:hypothetical protein
VQEPPIVSELVDQRHRRDLHKIRPGETPPVVSRSLLDNRWVVLAAIFFAMMFLGLPLLWRCPNFSRTEKVAWTIVVLVYSAVIIGGVIAIMSWSYGRVLETLGP